MKFSNTIVISLLIVVLVIGLGIGALVSHSYKSSYQAPSATTIIPQGTTVLPTTTIQSSLTPSITTTIAASVAQVNNTVVQVLYEDKTVHIAAPLHNYNYSYINGCYWISGYYNFSFVAPYTGYVIFNETNTGEPNNKTFAWFSMYLSNQKPIYYIASPYNLTSCTGEDFWYIIAPTSGIAPAKNQTMIVPVTNGTNYVIFYNDNAYNNWGLDSPINVTFSMKYVGFKPLVINNPFPPYTPVNVMKVNYSFTKVLLYNNITNSSIPGFKVNLAGIGVTNQATGQAPALIRVYYNNTLVNSTNPAYQVPGETYVAVLPGQNVSFSASGHNLTVYVNQTNYYGWATFYLSK